MSAKNYIQSCYKYPTINALSDHNWVPLITDPKIYINTDSWFDISKFSNPKPILEPIINIPNNLYSRSIPIHIYPNDAQKDILHKWFDLSRRMFNHTCTYINDCIFKSKEVHDLDFIIPELFSDPNINTFKIPQSQQFIESYKKAIESINFINLRNSIKRKGCEHLKTENINSHILSEMIKHCRAKYETSLKQIKTDLHFNRLKTFNVRYWKKDKRRKILILEAGLFSRNINGFCTSILGDMRSEYPISNMDSTCILIYDKFKGTYKIIKTKKENLHNDIPEKVVTRQRKDEVYEISITKFKKGVNNQKEKVCGIYPGGRKFLTVYSKNEVYEIGTHLENKFKKYYKKIDLINEHSDKGKIKKGSRRYQKALAKRYDRLENMIHDMHFKVGTRLCKEYSRIRIGKLSTKEIISNDNNLNKGTKRLFGTLSHYTFRERLKYLGLKYGCIVEEVDEYETTKKCSSCKTIKKVEKEEIYECCKCGIKIGRDINAAKNILNKA